MSCATPTLYNDGGAYQLRVSLNGQQFSFEAGQTLGFWALEELGQLSTALMIPAAGPYLGGSNLQEIRIPDPGIFPPSIEDIDELDRAVGAAFANREAIQLMPQCRFGEKVMPATRTSPNNYQCTAPSAEEAGASLDVAPRSARWPLRRGRRGQAEGGGNC